MQISTVTERIRGSGKRSKDQRNQKRPKSRRSRPWSQAQADSLPSEERQALDFLEEHDRQSRGSASHAIKVGRALSLLADRKSYLKLGLADMKQVCQAFYSIGERQGQDYQRAAGLYTLDEVGDTVHSLTGLLVMGEMARVYREALLVQGSGRTVAVLRDARGAAEACATEAEGLEAMAAMLARRKTALEVELGRIGRAVPQVSRRSRRIVVLLDEGQELDGEKGEELAVKVEGVMVDLSGLLARLRQSQAAAGDGEGGAGDGAADADDRAADIDDRAADIDDPAADIDDPAADIDDPAADIDDPAADIDDPAADIDDPAATAYDRPGPSMGPTSTPQVPEDVVSLLPLMALLRRGLPKAAWSVLAAILHSVVMGASPQQPVEALAGLFARCSWGGEPPQEKIDSVVRRLRQPVYDDRARFAVHCLFVVGTREARDILTQLLDEKLPTSVMVEIMWWQGQPGLDSG